MYKSIVVAVDGSDPANRALKVGAELAGISDAKLHLVYVVDSNNMEIRKDLRHMTEVEHIADPVHLNLESRSDAPVNLFKSINEASAESQRTFYLLAEYIVKQAKIVAKEAGAKDIETSIEIGNPAERILSFAKRHDSDLIVTGRRGLGAFKSLVLGSSSQKITQHAECSCLTVG
jgi:nucleotide-binding universal stress UspA family protein